MPRKSTKKAVPIVASPPPIARRPEPEWWKDAPKDERYLYPAHPHPANLRQIAEHVKLGVYRIPKFQRGFVWTDEQILYLLDSLLQGFFIGNTIIWERYKLPIERVEVAGIEATGTEHGYLIVDGQQRIGSIARAFLTNRFAFDFEQEKFILYEGPRRDVLPLSLLFNHTSQYSDVDVGLFGEDGWFQRYGSPSQYGWLKDKLLYRDTSCMVFPHQWEIDRVMETFRRFNTAGTRMTQEEVEAALRRSLEAT